MRFLVFRLPLGFRGWVVNAWLALYCAWGVFGDKGVRWDKLILFSGCLGYMRQPETLAKIASDGALKARRHLSKPAMLCLISHLATSHRRSIVDFRLPLMAIDGSLKPSAHGLHGCGSYTLPANLRLRLRRHSHA